MKGKDYLAVLSLDGTLSVFEQEAHTFSRFLPGFLVPGPITYVERTDSFIIANSSFGLDCFKYQSLAVATDSKTESQEISTGRKLVSDWGFGVGEPISDIQVGVQLELIVFTCLSKSRSFQVMTRTSHQLLSFLADKH